MKNFAKTTLMISAGLALSALTACMETDHAYYPDHHPVTVSRSYSTGSDVYSGSSGRGNSDVHYGSGSSSVSTSSASYGPQAYGSDAR